MKILQICTKPLFAPFDGGKIAMMNLAEGLSDEGVEIVQVMIETPGHPFPDTIPKNYPHRIIRVYIDTKISLKGLLKNIFSKESYFLSRFRHPALKTVLTDILANEQFDIVQAESPYVLAYLNEIQKCTKARIVLRAHNVEHLIWQRAAKGEANLLRRQYLRLQSQRLKREELAIMSSVAGLVAISEADLGLIKKMGVSTKASVVGIGTKLKAPEFMPDQVKKRHIFHLGAMNWFPNREGVYWFLKEVWPILKKSVPDVKLFLAGHGMPDDLINLNEPSIQIGQVQDAAAYMLEHGLMIVPLLSGSGIRVKIIEGLKLGKVVITTNIGAEGLGLTDGQELLIASDANDFAEKIRSCFVDHNLSIKISENARTFADKHFDTSLLAKRLLLFYQSLLKS